MKKQNLFWILLIVLSLVTFYGYRTMNALRADTRPPEIRMEADTLEVSVQDPKSALLRSITAKDQKDGDVTDSLVVENINLLDSSGTVQVTYAAFDAAGNVARAERQAVYTDYQSPRFTLHSPLIYRQGTSFDVLANVGATDVFDGDIQHRVRSTSLENNSISTLGTHMVEFQVTNSLGDTQTACFPVEVNSFDYSSAELTLTQYLVYLPVGTSFNPASYLNTFSYQRTETQLQGRIPAGFSLETEGQVKTGVPGTYAVSYALTYTQMNAANTAVAQEYTGYSKLIVIVEG